MTFFQQILIFVISYLCLYSIVERICQCFERCVTAKAFGKFKEAENLKGEKTNE